MECSKEEGQVMYELTIERIESRGVTIKQIAELTHYLQGPYDDLTIEFCIENVLAVLQKREVQNAVLTGIKLDELAEQNLLEGPLQDMVENDHSLYGIDEILAFSIINVYGSVAFTNYGYIDKVKPGILKEIDALGKGTNVCNTFLDDLIGAIAAASASRIAHRKNI